MNFFSWFEISQFFVVLQIKEMRARMKELIEEVTKKDERYKQLVEVFKQLPKDNRANYTLRILEMVKNVKKQKVEINKVI